MNITDIKIRHVNHGKLKAVATVTFDNQFVVHDIKLIEGLDKKFLAMPSKVLADGTHMDIVHPISKDLRTSLENAVFEQYQASLLNDESYTADISEVSPTE